MKIQFILNYSDLYGANRSINTLITYLHSRGYKVSVLLPSYGDMYNELIKKEIPCKVIRFFPAFLYVKPKLKFLILPFLQIYNAIIFPYILFYIRCNKPNVIYSNTSAENLGVIAAKLLKTKHISHVREFMSLDHNAFFIFGKTLKKKYIQLSNGVIYVSESVKKYIENNSISEKPSIVVYNGVASPENNNITKTINYDNIRLGLVGIFDPAKGQDVAINYFAELLKINENFTLHFFGEKKGAYKNHLLDQVKKLDLNKKIFFHGFIKDVDVVFNNIDILLMFSRSEGFGRVTVESMQRGIPVLGFNNAGTSEIIINQENGFLFQDKNDFLNSIQLLLQDNIYERISKKAQKIANERFNETLYCTRIERFIIDIIEL